MEKLIIELEVSELDGDDHEAFGLVQDVLEKIKKVIQEHSDPECGMLTVESIKLVSVPELPSRFPKYAVNSASIFDKGIGWDYPVPVPPDKKYYWRLAGSAIYNAEVIWYWERD